MQKFLLVISLFVCAFPAVCQDDYLLLKNGDMMWVRTVSKSGDSIRYSIPDDKDSVIYAVSKDEVRKWVSGKKMAKKSAFKKGGDSLYPFNGRHFAGVDFFYVAYAMYKFDYRQMMANKKFSWGTFVWVNMATPMYCYKEDIPENTTDPYAPGLHAVKYEYMCTGLSLQRYFKVQGEFLYLGCAVRGSLFKYAYLYSRVMPASPNANKPVKKDSYVVSGDVSAGYLRRFAKGYFVDVSIAARYRKWEITIIDPPKTFSIQPSVILGFNF